MKMQDRTDSQLRQQGSQLGTRNEGGRGEQTHHVGQPHELSASDKPYGHGAYGGAGLGAFNDGPFGESRTFMGYYGALRPAAGRGFRGRGPRGYQRTDARIADDVNQRLFDDDDVDATDIEVSVSSGEVTLSGTVADREMKQRTDDLVAHVSGVLQVLNHLRIIHPAPPPAKTSEPAKSKNANA
jgi:hypothetical protein